MTDFTVLGILGPSGVGKDLVADWFVKKGFVKIAFADPMKRFVSKAFGIDWDRLWGPSEKRNEIFEITESWWFEVIGHFGHAASEIVNEVLTPDTRVSGYMALHDWLTNLRKTYRTKISARVILQTLGTEWGRTVDEFMWIRYANVVAQKIKPYRYSPSPYVYTQVTGLHKNTNTSEPRPIGVVIADHRFRNEVEYIQKIGGYVIRLRRPEYEKNLAEIGIAGHKSEAEQKELPDNLFDVIYELPEGIEKVFPLLEDAYKERIWARKWDKTNELECNVFSYTTISTPIL